MEKLNLARLATDLFGYIVTSHDEKVEFAMLNELHKYPVTNS